MNNESIQPADKLVCDLLAKTIELHLKEAESKIWPGHMVLFLDVHCYR